MFSLTLTVFVGPVKNPNKFNIFTLVKFDSDNFDIPLTLTIFHGPMEEILRLKLWLLNFDFGLNFAIHPYTRFFHIEEKDL